MMVTVHILSIIMQKRCFIWLFVQNLRKNGSFSTYIVIKYRIGREKLGFFSFSYLLIPLYMDYLGLGIISKICLKPFQTIDKLFYQYQNRSILSMPILHGHYKLFSYVFKPFQKAFS